MNTFGSWLRTMRERTVYGDHSMTQEEFASELKRYYVKPVKSNDEGFKEISKSAVSSWESGNKNAPLQDNQFVEAIARIFNVTVAEVLKGSGYDLGAAYSDELDETRRLLLEAYDNGSLETMVKLALEAHARRRGDHSRLSTEGENDGHTGNEATKSARR